jgi:predicted Zn-dependent protease
MNASGNFGKSLAAVMALWEEEHYDRAMERLDQLRAEWPGNPHLQVLAARLAQLQDNPALSLADIKRLLQQAAELDQQSPVATIELAYFLDNVEDDPQAAVKSFSHGISLARQSLIDGLLGQAHSLLQLDEREDAMRSLAEALRLADLEKPTIKKRYTERIESLLAELGQTQSA